MANYALPLFLLLSVLSFSRADLGRPTFEDPFFCDGCRVQGVYSQTPRVYVNNDVIVNDFNDENFLQIAFDAYDNNLAFWGWFAFGPKTVEGCQSVLPEYVYMLKYQRRYYTGNRYFLEHLDAVYIHSAFQPTQAAWNRYCENTYDTPLGGYWVERDGQPVTDSFRSRFYTRISVRYSQEGCLLNKKLSSLSSICDFETVGVDNLFPSQRFCEVYDDDNFTTSVILSMGCDAAENNCNSHYQTNPADVTRRGAEVEADAHTTRQVDTNLYPDESSDATCWYVDTWGFPAHLSLLSSASLLAASASLAISFVAALL